MENLAAIEALLRIRTELIADLRAAERARMALFKRVAKLDADLEALGGKGCAKPRNINLRRHTFRRGELQRHIATVLRERGPEIANREIAEIILKGVGVNGPTGRMINSLCSQIGVIRRRMANLTPRGAASILSKCG